MRIILVRLSNTLLKAVVEERPGYINVSSLGRFLHKTPGTESAVRAKSYPIRGDDKWFEAGSKTSVGWAICFVIIRLRVSGDTLRAMVL